MVRPGVLGGAILRALPWPDHLAVTVIHDGYASDDSDRRARLHELVAWIRTQTSADETVMAYPPDGLHQLQFEYDRKTVLIPNNDLMTVLHVARKYEADYIVISKGLLRDQDKGFEQLWRLTPEGIEGLPMVDSLEPVYENANRSILIYRMNRK